VNNSRLSKFSETAEPRERLEKGHGREEKSRFKKKNCDKKTWGSMDIGAYTGKGNHSEEEKLKGGEGGVRVKKRGHTLGKDPPKSLLRGSRKGER